MDNKAARRRIECLKEHAERVQRFLNAFNGFTRITGTEIEARRVSRAGMFRLLPKQVIPITFLWFTIGHETVVVGDQRDAQEALKAKIAELDDGGMLREIISACNKMLAGNHFPDNDEIAAAEEACERLEEKVRQRSKEQRELVNSTCNPIPVVGRVRRRY